MSNQVFIHLDKTDFTGGEVVSGELELQIASKLPVRAVRLLWHGYEHSYWSRGAHRVWSSGTGWVRDSHSQTLDLFKEEMTLFGDPPLDTAALISDSIAGLFASGNYHTLEPGTYRYPFSYRLPEHLPGDYEDRSGKAKIKYLIKGYVDIPLKVDIECVVPLTIYEPHDEGAVQPVSRVNDIALFDAETRVKIGADLDKDAYYPGEAVDCRLRIENFSGKPVQAITISLQKIETLWAQNTSTTHISDIHSTRYENIHIPTGETADPRLQFTVPEHLYPTVVSSTLIQVEYRIVAALEIPWASGIDIPWGMELDVGVPIVLLEESQKPGLKA